VKHTSTFGFLHCFQYLYIQASNIFYKTFKFRLQTVFKTLWSKFLVGTWNSTTLVPISIMDIPTSYQLKVNSKSYDSNFLHCNLCYNSSWVHLRTLQSLDVDFKHCIVFCVAFQIRRIVYSRTKMQWWVIKLVCGGIFGNPLYGCPSTILKTI
jgi:hypothetical protein